MIPAWLAASFVLAFGIVLGVVLMTVGWVFPAIPNLFGHDPLQYRVHGFLIWAWCITVLIIRNNLE